MKIALCDDDRTSLEDTEKTLAVFADKRGFDLQVFSFESVDALLASNDLPSFKLVFMDIEFEGEPMGIAAAERINQIAPDCRVVYLTNYIQYSVDVYHTNHVWFVVKSQFERRLPEIFEKVSRIEDARRSQLVVTLKDGSVLNVLCRDILYLERRKRVTFITTAVTTYETPEKLADICKKLPEAPFSYSHNSYVVNMAHIAQIHANELVFKSGQTAPISRRYAKRFRDRYFDWAEQWTV
ncbi:MAG: LytTR family DNA-binding domain-containing protein [Coriobacteriia bacterium]|nr:LytTR family DNA-binding domain-containing protein [Coriobacteriia bacterium]